MHRPNRLIAARLRFALGLRRRTSWADKNLRRGDPGTAVAATALLVTTRTRETEGAPFRRREETVLYRVQDHLATFLVGAEADGSLPLFVKRLDRGSLLMEGRDRR